MIADQIPQAALTDTLHRPAGGLFAGSHCASRADEPWASEDSATSLKPGPFKNRPQPHDPIRCRSLGAQRSLTHN